MKLFVTTRFLNMQKNISDNKILKQKNAPIHTNWCIQYRSNVNYTFTLPCQQ